MNEIIFVKSGQVDITILSGQKHYLIGSISKGNYFGDSEYYKNVCSIATYRAVLHCELLSVSHSVFDIANRKHLNAGVRFKNEIQQRFNNLEEIIKLCKKEIMGKLHNHDKTTLSSSSLKSYKASSSFQSTPLSPASSSSSPSRRKFYISNDTSLSSSSSYGSTNSSSNRLELVHCSNVVINGEIKDISEAAARQHTPKIAFVSQPKAYTSSSGKTVKAADVDLLVRALSMGKLHHAMMGTAAVAIGTAAAIPGT